MSDPDIGVTFGSQIKTAASWVGTNPYLLPWILVGFLIYHVTTGQEHYWSQTISWQQQILQTVKDEQAAITGHVKMSEEEAERARGSRATIADYMMIYCYNGATDASQRRRCIEREIPTYDHGSYGRERSGAR